MSSDLNPELRKELLDDFYAECDEQLSHIRTDLSALESTADGGKSEQETFEGLLRNIHSLKGNSAIVGLRLAEELAHLTEDFLRPYSRGERGVSSAAIDLLMTATQRLEQIVGAHRQKTALPEIEDLRTRLTLSTPAPVSSPPKEALPQSTIVPPAPELKSLLEKARARGLILWQGTFLPSSLLDQRGINITVVRARFSELGEIIRATPMIRPGGTMAFEFYLGLKSVPADLAAWEVDGIFLKALDDPEPEAKAIIAAAAEIREHDSAQSLFVAPSHIVRVDLGRLDDLMRLTGELVIHRSRLDDRIAQTTGDVSALKEVSHGLGRSLRELRQAITRVRLVPIAEIFSRLPFVVRDLSRETKKQVKLVVEGQQTEIDKYLVERLKEPLLHLVRNAFSHGIESADQRVAASKPVEGTILLRAFASGESVIIQIRDDGQGIDAAKIAARATALKLPLPEKLDHAGVLSLLCSPGFSTRDEADLTSGRGVGMAVVKSTVRELGGTLTLETTPGIGTQFTLRLPLTLSIVETLIVSVGDQTCAIPQAFIEEIVLIEEKSITTIKQVETTPYRDGLLPLVRLRTLFRSEPTKRLESPVLVVSSDRGSTGLVVDRVHTRREVVVRPMRDPLIQVPGIAGATELGDGRPVLILDALALTQGAVRPPSSKR